MALLSYFIWKNIACLEVIDYHKVTDIMNNTDETHKPTYDSNARPPCPSQLLEFTQTHVLWVGDAIQPSHPLSSPSPPTFNLSSIRVFSNELVLHIRWPKYWSFSFNISPSNEHSGLLSFKMDWLDLISVQGTLRSLFQYHSVGASVYVSSYISYSLMHQIW